MTSSIMQQCHKTKTKKHKRQQKKHDLKKNKRARAPRLNV